MKFNSSKRISHLSLIVIISVLISPHVLFIYNLIFSNNIPNIHNGNISSKESLLKTSEYGHGGISYDMIVGSSSYYSSGSNIYWDFINHDNVDIRVLAMTGSQFGDAVMGGRPVQYNSLLMEDTQGYGYFTVPSNGQWAIGFHHRDSSHGSTEIYFNVGGSPYLRITKPSSTDKLIKKDTTYKIEWTNYYVADAKIELWKSSNYIYDISPILLRSGFYPSYNWYVPNSLDEGTDYRIKIVNHVNPNIYDFSDYFEIYENDLIDIIEPNSNSIFGTSTNQEILWTWYGLISSLDLELWDDTIFLDQITASSTECDGLYTWELPYNISEGNNYKIKIINHDEPLLYNFSDFFTIYDASPPLIIIQEPVNYSLTSQSPPIFTIDILELNLDGVWYQLQNDTFFTDIYSWEGQIEQSVWDQIGNGTLQFNIYANDTNGNTESESLVLYKDVMSPAIYIHEPTPSKVCGIHAPEVTIEIIDPNLEGAWYQLQNDTFFTDIYSWGGEIEQSAWDQIGNGTLQFNIYANDTNGNTEFESLFLYKDILSPEIYIYEPTPSKVYGIQAPEVIIEITDPNLDRVWYSLNDGINITYIAQTQIDQTEWDKCNNGTILMKIFAKDTVGNKEVIEVLIRKDAFEPIIIIHSPYLDQRFKTTSPIFNLSILEETITSNWYMIFGNINEFHFTNLNDSIDQMAWNEMPKGLVELTFYARDEAGNIGSASISIIKEINEDFIILGYDLLLIIGIIGIFSIIKLSKSIQLTSMKKRV